ncbi:transcriptional regulator ATRX-like [Bufo bufo]|nr:transcriptional regulator ATRX-like [Bufo bufo]
METSDTAPPDVAEHVEVEVEEEGGPSQPHTSPAAAIPPAEVTEEEEEQEVAAQSEEEEELVTTPQQEGINNLIKKIKGVIKDQKKKSEAFRLQMQELEKRHRLLERQNQRDLREVLDQLEQLKKHR